MKRPQGFDQPSARTGRTGRAVPDRALGDIAPGAAPLPDAAPLPGANLPAGDPDTVSTLPIAIVGTTESTDLTGAPSAAIPGPADDQAVDVRPGVGVDTAPRARSAGRGVAAAARERRRYERHEVRRFTQRSRRRRRVWLVVLGSIAALVVVVGVGAYSPLMALREVRVEGAQRIPGAEIQAAFAPTLGTPLPLIASADVHAALSAFPLIETYSTETVPPGTLVVRIVERTPVGVVETEEGLELVDAAGVVIDRPAERPDGQPLITSEGGVAGEGFRAAASVVRSLPPEVRAQLVGVHAATADDVRLELVEGVSVVWGSAEDSALKATVLAALMHAAPPETVSRYDVSAPSNAVAE